MGDNNILPKGGFLRGVLAGLTLIALIFIGLANYFPLIAASDLTPATVTELNSAPVQPVVEPEESSSGLALSTEEPTTAQLVTNPTPLGDVTPDVTIEPETAAPVSMVSQLEALPTNDIQIGGESSLPVVAQPTVSAIEMPVAAETPTVAETTQAPVVSTEISAASNENDVTTEPQVSEQVVTPDPVPEDAVKPATDNSVTEEPSTGVELAGQTLIDTSEPAPVDAVDPSSAPDTAFDAFSAVFTDNGELPLMSFILLANTVAEAEVVSGFATPITLAITSDNPAANDIIASYRASGGEVVLLLPSDGANALRKGGNPSDAAAFIDASLANIEGVLGVMDGPNGDVNQDTRMISAMLVKLSETGHAIMTVNGLGRNRTSILAHEAGVPATDISRVIDTVDGTIAVIRVLDKLVLQIGDQHSVTVFAHATPDMLFALKFWLESQKAQAVTIAPVSTSILRN